MPDPIVDETFLIYAALMQESAARYSALRDAVAELAQRQGIPPSEFEATLAKHYARYRESLYLSVGDRNPKVADKLAELLKQMQSDPGRPSSGA